MQLAAHLNSNFLFSGWEILDLVYWSGGKTAAIKLSYECCTWANHCKLIKSFCYVMLCLCISYPHATFLQKQLQPERESQCLSLVYANGESSLDLVIRKVSSLCNKYFLQYRTFFMHIFYLYVDIQGQRAGWDLVFGFESRNIQ